jgi:hypothetical protein
MYHKQKPLRNCINKRAKMQHLKPTIQQTNEALLQDSKAIANVYPKKKTAPDLIARLTTLMNRVRVTG